MNNEFEKILDDAERKLGNKDELFAFVIYGLKTNPNAQIRELIGLKKIYDEQNKAKSRMINSSSFSQPGMSRAQRRAMGRINKKKGNKKK